MQPELLWRINVGVETLNRTGEQTSRQMADLVARVEASLQFVVKAWQEATGQGKARLMTKDELAQIRGALVAALEATGGSMVEEDESGLTAETADLEAQLRAAIRLIDKAEPPPA